MESTKFSGICLIVASIIVAGAIIWHGRVGRYQPVPPGANGFRIDTTTGQFEH